MGGVAEMTLAARWKQVKPVAVAYRGSGVGKSVSVMANSVASRLRQCHICHNFKVCHCCLHIRGYNSWVAIKTKFVNCLDGRLKKIIGCIGRLAK